MESRIIIYDRLGQELLQAPVTRECLRKRVLMGENHVLLVFNHDSYIDFIKGSYIIYKGFRFEIMTDVYPEMHKNGWKYSLQFDAKDGFLRKYNIFYRKQDIAEVAFALTTDLLSFGNVICDCINHELGGTNWRVKAIPAEFADLMKTLSFKGEKLFDALTMIAEQFECEWWIEENGEFVDICFGKLTLGTEEEFEEGKVVTSIPRKAGDNSDFGTRFFVYGSTRNLTSDYGQVEQGGTTNHISEIRLRLPDGMNYIDAWENLAPTDVVHQIAFFDDIYPKNTDIITKVETVKRQIEGSEETFDAYVITAENTPFIPSDIIEGETLGCVFETGALQSQSFELKINYDPKTWKPSDGFDKKFEIIHVMNGDIIVPNASFKPEVGDKFVITGVKLPKERIKEAEQELLQAGQAWAKKKSQDTSVYDCPTNPVFCQENEKNYDLGQKVKLVGNRFGVSGRSSRIQGYEKKLWNNYEATYTVGDNSPYSRLGHIEGEIKESQYSERIGVVKGVGIYLIRNNFDNTQPTNYNAYSALASLKKFVTYTGFVNQPVRTTDDVQFANVSTHKVTADELGSAAFMSGLLGTGFRLKDSHLELDELTVRKVMNVYELLIQQVRAIGGQFVISPANQKILKTEEVPDGYKCFFDTAGGTVPNPFVLDDQLLCQTFTGNIKRYWRKVILTGADYFVLSKTDAEEGSTVPRAGDEVVLLGNRTDTARQSALLLNSYGNDAPYLSAYAGINGYDLSGKEPVRVGNLSGIVDETFGQLKGYGLFADHVYIKGQFSFNSGKVIEEELGRVEDKTDEAQQAATEAATNALEAGRKAASALSSISEISSDNIVSPVEKSALKKEWDIIVSERLKIKAQGTTYGVSTTAYDNAYNALSALIRTNLDDLSTNWNISGATLRSTFKAYYDARTDLLNLIAKVTKDKADKAETDAGNAQDAADQARAEADNANAAIAVMNDDSVFDIKEKQSIRTQWENINGVANTTGTGTSGSYYKTKSLGAGLSQLSALTTAYTNLRTYLNGLALYTDSNIGNFSRATMAQKFTAYYDAEIALNNAIADKIAGDKVADIQIGGRNLISNSDFSTTDISMYSKSANSIYTITRENGMLKIVGSKASNSSGEDNIIYVNTLKPNEDGDYTISFDGYALAPTTWYYRFGFFGAAENMARIEVGTTKKRYSATFKGGRYNDTYSTSVMWFNTATTLYIDNIKLEKGNKATAWSPAIEDVQKAVEAADTKAAQAKADAKTANDTLNSWKADGVISPLEKQAIKETQAAVLAEKNEIVAEAAKYSVSSTAYVTAWTNYNIQLSNHSKASPENITIAAALATTQTAYSSAKVAIRQAIADAARTYAGKVANDAVAGLKIGTRNLLWYSGRLIQNNDYNPAVYDATIDLVTGKKYTFALRGTTTGGQKMGLWMNGGSGGQQGFLKTNQADEVSFFTFTAIAPLSEVYKRRLHIYNYPSSGSAANPATIKWAALYEGEVKPPEDWSPAPEEVEESIQLAQTSADAANAKLADIASDNKLTAQEKQATKKEWDIIVSEKANVTAQGTAYGVSTTAYTNAYNALNTYITPLLANLTTTSDIVGTTFRTNFKNYYDARTALLKAVLDKAKQLTTNAQNAADAAKRAADAAQSTADTAKTNAQAANTALADWASDSKISPAEKTLLKQQKADISAEYNEISSQVTRYALTADASWTNYRTAYNNAIAAFNKYTAASPQFINVGSDYNNIAAYYTKRQTVLDNIALKAKQYADSVGNVVETRVNAKIDTKADRVELSSLQNNFNSLGNRVSKTEGSISTIQGRVDVLSTNVNSISGQITSLGVKLDSVSGQLNLFARKDDLFTGITLKPELIKVTGQTVFIDSAGNEVAMFKAGKVINVNNGVCSVDNAGKLIAKNAEISGKITASEGQFGNLKIMGSDEITFTSTDGCIRFASPDAGYTKINKTGTNVEIANWEGNCLSLAGYSSNGIALSILQQKGGKAIDTHGNLQFTLRQSEKLDIISNNSGKGVVNIDAAICFNPVVISNSITLGSPGTATSVGFLVLCTNTSAITVYLPSSPFSGQTIYIRRCRAKVTIHGNGINIFRTNSAQSSWDLTNEGHMGRLVYYSGRWYANYLDI